MYRYNFFCFACCLLGALIAFVVLKDIQYTTLSLVLAMFNYVLYFTGKQKSKC